MARVIICCIVSLSLVLLTQCKKEKKEEATVFPAILELSGTIPLPTAVGMVFAGDPNSTNVPFMVGLSTLAPNPQGTFGTIQFAALNPHNGSTRLSEFIPPHTVSIKDPNYKTSFTIEINSSRLVSVYSEFKNDTSTTIVFKQFSLDGKSLFNIRTETINKRLEITRIVAISDGFIICGTAFNGGNRDVFVAKYNTSLTLRWEKTFGGPANDGAMDAVQLCDNEIGILAYTYSFGQGDRDIWFIKLGNLLGDSKLQATYGTSGYEEPQRIIKDKQCRYYIAGHTAGFGHPEHNAYIVAIDQNGGFIWENNYGTPLHDGFQAISLLPNNQGLLAAGRSMQTNAPHENIFVQALGFDGKPLWSKTYGDPNLTEIPTDIITDNQFYYLLSNRIDAAGKFSVIFVKDELVK